MCFIYQCFVSIYEVHSNVLVLENTIFPKFQNKQKIVHTYKVTVCRKIKNNFFLWGHIVYSFHFVD